MYSYNKNAFRQFIFNKKEHDRLPSIAKNVLVITKSWHQLMNAMVKAVCSGRDSCLLISPIVNKQIFLACVQLLFN